MFFLPVNNPMFVKIIQSQDYLQPKEKSFKIGLKRQVKKLWDVFHVQGIICTEAIHVTQEVLQLIPILTARGD